MTIKQIIKAIASKYLQQLILVCLFQIVGLVHSWIEGTRDFIVQTVILAFTLMLFVFRVQQNRQSQKRNPMLQVMMQVFLSCLICFSNWGASESLLIKSFLLGYQMQAVRFKVSYIYAASRASKCFNYTGLQAAISGVLIWLSWTSASADFVAIIAILMFIVVTQLSSALYYETVVKRYLRSPGPAITPQFQQRCKTQMVVISDREQIYKTPILDVSPPPDAPSPDPSEQMAPNFYREILKSFSDGVIIMDVNHDTVFVGSSVCDLMGTSHRPQAVKMVMNLRNCQQEFQRQTQVAQMFSKVMRTKTVKHIKEHEDDEDELQDTPVLHRFNIEDFVTESGTVKEELDRISRTLSQQQTNENEFDQASITFLQEVNMICSRDGKEEGAHSGFTMTTLFQIGIKLFIYGGRRLFLFLVKDVTHFNQIRALQAINENKSQMLSQVSHEFRTPLNCIILLVEDLMEESIETVRNNYLRPVLSSAKALLSLIHDLLDLAQLKAGKFKLMHFDFNLIELFEELKRFLETNVQQKGTHIEIDVAPDLNADIISDGNRIRQILINLIGNSAKFTKNGTITIGASTVKSIDKRKPDMIEIYVADTGIGIAEEDQKRLFEAFGKLDHGKELNAQGVGLGLMISNILAERLSVYDNDGDAPPTKPVGLQVYSEGIGKGTRFTFQVQNQSNTWTSKHLIKKATIQCIKKIQLDSASIKLNDTLNSLSQYSYKQLFDKSNEVQLQRKISKAQFDLPMVRNPVGEVKSPVRISTISEFQSVAIPSMDQFKKPCECPEILIVDDTPFNILALRTVLKKHKLRIDSAASGEEAIEKVLEYEVNNMCNMNYSHKQYSYILMDIEMGSRMDGLTATRRILKLRGVKLPKIIGCSGHSPQEMEAKCLEAGMIGYLTKPVNVVKLLELISEVKS